MLIKIFADLVIGKPSKEESGPGREMNKWMVGAALRMWKRAYSTGHFVFLCIPVTFKVKLFAAFDHFLFQKITGYLRLFQ